MNAAVPHLRSKTIIAALLLAAGTAAIAGRSWSSPRRTSLIQSSIPATGSLGQVLTITGGPFTAKPSAWLTPDGSTKKLPLKVLDFTDTWFTASVGSAVLGAHDLHVKVKNETDDLSNAFTANIGSMGQVNPNFTLPGEASAVFGADFGLVRGKLLVGGKTAKITSWTDTRIGFVTPTAGIGDQTLAISNKLGQFTGSSSLFVGAAPPSASGANNVSGLFGSTSLVFTAQQVLPQYNFQLHQGTVTCASPASGNTPARSLTFTIPYNLNVDKAPKSYTSIDGFAISYSETPLGGSTTTWALSGPGGFGHMYVKSENGSEQVGSHMSASAVGTLGRTSGTGGDPTINYSIGFRGFF